MSAVPSPQPSQWQYLAPNPHSSYKQLFVKGTRLRAEVVYGLTVDGDEPMTPEAVAADYELPLKAVREAIAYCESDPPEVREDHRREERIMEATGMNAANYRFGGEYELLTPEDRARLGI